MSLKNADGELISFECSDLIAEVEADMLEFRRQKKIYAACRLDHGVKIIFDYVFDVHDQEEMALFPSLKSDEWFEKMSFSELYAYLVRENNITDQYASFKALFCATGWTIKRFSEYFKIPLRTVQDWIYGKRECPSYLLNLMNYKLINENIL